MALRLASLACVVLGLVMAVPAEVARADGHSVVLSASVSCYGAQKQVQWTATAWAGPTPESRTNPSVGAAVFRGTELVEGPFIDAFTPANGFSFSGTVLLPGDMGGTVDLLGIAIGTWGDGTAGNSLPTSIPVDLGPDCEGPILGHAPVVSIQAICVSPFYAIGWNAVAWNGPTPEARTNPRIRVSFSGVISQLPVIGAFTPGNGFLFNDFALLPGNIAGTATVSAVALDPWGDGTAPDPTPVTQSLELDGSCAPTEDYAVGLTSSVECVAGTYEIDWTATAWDGPTVESRTNPTVAVLMLVEGDVHEHLGEFGPASGFSFSGTFTLPGTFSSSSSPVFLGAQASADWADGAPAAGPTINVLAFAGDCTLPTVPGAPTGAQAVAGLNEATVSWTAPAVPPGHEPPTEYIVTSSPGSSGCSVTPPEPLSCVVEHLPSGAPVTFTVTAHNGLGEGGSVTTAAATPAEALDVELTADLVEVEVGGTVTYTATATNGSDAAARPFTAQDVAVSVELPAGMTLVAGSEACTGGGTATATTGAGGTVTFAPAGLAPGASRECSVDAVAQAPPAVVAARAAATATSGGGAVAHEIVSDDVDVTIVAASPPTSPPTGVSGTGGDRQVAVSWVAPVVPLGAAPATGYLVTAQPGAATCSTTGATSCVVSGLTNGTPYTFTVTASTTAGAGSSSSPSSPVTPMATPQPHVAAATGQADPTNQPVIRLTVSFGQQIDGFDAGDIELGGTANPANVTVTPVVGNPFTLASGETFTVEVSGMTGSGTVMVRVRAGAVTNANQQTSLATDWFTIAYDVTPPVLVLPPVSVTAVAAAGAGGAIVSWDAGAGSGETVVCSPPSGSLLPIGTTRVSCTATDPAGNSVTRAFDVVVSAAPAGPSPAGPTGTLPATGGDQHTIAAVALALVVLGALITGAGRARATAGSSRSWR